MTAPFFTREGLLTKNIGIQALSRTSYAEFPNFQAPKLPSKTFQGLEKWK